ncbi:Aristolochene synthase from penicillium Roqueforti [Astrocystis sublimbata]|nr:Aristolochene synthase from penicillium Roqueforti [Astrocystis sublimbata]
MAAILSPVQSMDIKKDTISITSQEARIPSPPISEVSREADWTPLCHPKVDEVSREVDDYFLQHWNFPGTKARRTFVNAGFSRVTCLYFPLAKDDRIHFACRLLTVLFLIDDLLEDMSFEDGSSYNEKLIPIARGDVLPDRSVPVEYITYDLWESMRAHDKELADEVLEPTFTFMRAQTDKARLTITELGHYLEYREKDVGKALLSALMRFSMDLHLTPSELVRMKPLEQNCSKHISIVNDIWSYEKEARSAQTGHKEGAFLCNAMSVFGNSTSLDIDASRRVLTYMTWEWARVHDTLVAEVEATGCHEAVGEYMKGLEYQMSGNELWSKTTLRYSQVE